MYIHICICMYVFQRGRCRPTPSHYLYQRRQRRFRHIFHGRNPHTQLCCSSHTCMFFTNVAPFKREINRLSKRIRFIAKQHCYNKEILYQTQISLLFVLCLYIHNLKSNCWFFFYSMVVVTHAHFAAVAQLVLYQLSKSLIIKFVVWFLEK